MIQLPNDIEHHTIKKTESHTVIKPKYDDKQLKPGNTRNQSHTDSKQNTKRPMRQQQQQKNPRKTTFYTNFA